MPFNCTEQVESSNLKETKTAKNVEVLKKLMAKYNRTNEEELLREIMAGNDPTDLVTFRVLFTGPYIRTIQAQAIQELCVEKEMSGYTYVDKFIDECPTPVDCLSVEETAALHLQWCREQNIDIWDFLMKEYCILSKTFPKINCLMLQTVQSQDFMYQRCLQKEVIQIPEMTLSKPEQVEETKKIFEGLPTTVNIKFKDPRILDRTPVILTCNALPWKFFNEEAATFQNRMFAFMNLRPSALLESKKSANPKYFRRVFDFIKNEIQTLPEFPCAPDDQHMWELYCEMISNYVQSLQVMQDIDLQHVLESETLQDQYLMREEYGLNNLGTHDVLNVRSTERLECSETDLLSELYSWLYTLYQYCSDDYYFQIANGNTIMMSSFQSAEYDGDRDLDYQDYLNFRQGYAHIKRLLLRLKLWPQVVDERSSMKKRLRYILRNSVEYIGKFLAALLNTHKEKCLALKQAWDACEADMPSREEISEMVKNNLCSSPVCSRTPSRKRVADEMDCARARSVWKKFKASLPGINLTCTSVVRSSSMETQPPSPQPGPSKPRGTAQKSAG